MDGSAAKQKRRSSSLIPAALSRGSPFRNKRPNSTPAIKITTSNADVSNSTDKPLTKPRNKSTYSTVLYNSKSKNNSNSNFSTSDNNNNKYSNKNNNQKSNNVRNSPSFFSIKSSNREHSSETRHSHQAWSEMLSSVFEAATSAPVVNPMLLVVKIVLIGRHCSGKTSIVQQFLSNKFSDIYRPTRRKNVHHPTILMNDKVYQIRILDLPPVTRFPSNSVDEWNHCRGYGLHSASAYILVFDITDRESFTAMASLYHEIIAIPEIRRRKPPIIIVGNKKDLVESDDAKLYPIISSSGQPENHQRNDPPCANSVRYGACQKHSGTSPVSHSPRIDNNNNACITVLSSKDISALIQKQWKCTYVECSAKHNWHVDDVFEETMRALCASEHMTLRSWHSLLSDGNERSDSGKRCCVQ